MRYHIGIAERAVYCEARSLECNIYNRSNTSMERYHRLAHKQAQKLDPTTQVHKLHPNIFAHGIRSCV
jgi:hypothetical protein